MNMQLVRAIANPTRIRILEAMTGGSATPAQLAEDLGERLSVISYHVEVLRTTGCVKFANKDERAPADRRTYEIAPEAAATRYLVRPKLSNWGLSHPPASLVRSIVNRGGNADLDLSEFGGRKRHHQLSCASIVVDQKGWREISTALGDVLDRVAAAHRESAKRLEESGEDGISATFALASFESGPDAAG